MEFIISASTDVGNVKKTNQDSVGARVFTTQQGKMVFCVLCDGMGGLAKGELASASVVNAFMNWSVTKLPVLCGGVITESQIMSDWSALVSEFNEKIKNYGRRAGINLGTTVVAALFTSDKYYILNVGDSRAYELYDRTAVITKDQTFVAREVELGNMTLEQAAADPRRSVLLQCIGASDFVNPDFFFGEIKKDAVYMLCSDGFRHEISEDEIFQYLQPNVMLDDAGMKNNMDYLISLNKQRLERDNITVMTVRTY